MCEITLSAYKAVCKIAGGVSDIWLISKAAREGTAVTYSVTNNALTIGGTGGIAYHIIPRENNCTVTNPRADDNTAGSTFVTETLEFTTHGITAALLYMHDQVGKGTAEALVKFVSGTYLMLGLSDNGLQSNGGDAGFSGTAKADAQGLTFNLTSESTIAPPTLANFTEFTTAFTVTEPA